MNSTVEKLRQLEQYLSNSYHFNDPVVEMTIDKLLDYERQNILEQKKRLQMRCKEFENTYSMKSEKFYIRFEKGELGDKMDFFEWASTIDMLKEVDKDLSLLEGSNNE
jgi:hypothetical protein